MYLVYLFILAPIVVVWTLLRHYTSEVSTAGWQRHWFAVSIVAFVIDVVMYSRNPYDMMFNLASLFAGGVVLLYWMVFYKTMFDDIESIPSPTNSN